MPFDALVDVYKDIAKAKDAIAAAQKVAVVPTTELKEVFTGPIDEQRIALKRLVKRVVVSRVENTASVKVHLTNGHFKVFGVNIGVKRASGKNTIFVKSDTEQMTSWFNDAKGELHPWET